MISRNIYQAGIELEGAFEDNDVSTGGYFKGDCSIEGLAGYNGEVDDERWCDDCDDYVIGSCNHLDTDNGLVENVVGEKVSQPIGSLPRLFRWMKRNWVEEYNSTCGMHVHFSFGNIVADVAQHRDCNCRQCRQLIQNEIVYDREFHKHIGLYSACIHGSPQKHILDELAKEFKLIKVPNRRTRNHPSYESTTNSQYNLSDLTERMSGDNTFCRPSLDYANAFNCNGADRYSMVNVDAWYGHRTLEIRVLPMMEFYPATRAIICLVKGLEKAIWEGRKLINTRKEISEFKLSLIRNIENDIEGDYISTLEETIKDKRLRIKTFETIYQTPYIEYFDSAGEIARVEY